MVIKQNKGYKLPMSKIQIIKSYLLGISCYQIAKICNCSPQAIYAILKSTNTPRRSLSKAATKYTHDKKFFQKIDTEEKAYFLGLLYADGNVSKNVLSISLQEQDRSILDKLKNALSYTGPITPITKKDKRKQQWKLAITSKELIISLLTHGLYPNKGTTLKFPDTVPSFLLVHFIRGYFDGDGCIYTNFKNHDYLFSIVAPQNFLLKIQELMIKDLSLTKTKLYNPKNCKDTQLHILTYQGRKNLLRIRDWLYKDANIYLSRKKDKFFII